MKNCTHCKHAHWQKTAAGKLHPSGDGRCDYQVKIPPLPASKHWGYSFQERPSISGGFINRRRDLNDHCTYYVREEAQS